MMKFFVFHQYKVFQPNFLILILLYIYLALHKYVVFHLFYELLDDLCLHFPLFCLQQSLKLLFQYFSLDFQFLNLCFPLFFRLKNLNSLNCRYFDHYSQFPQKLSHYYQFVRLKVDYFDQLLIVFLVQSFFALHLNFFYHLLDQ